MTAIRAQHVADILGTGILPDDGVVVGFACVLVPDDGGLALVGHANCGDITGLDSCLCDGALDDFLGGRPYLHRVVFNPSRRRVDLLML